MWMCTPLAGGFQRCVVDSYVGGRDGGGSAETSDPDAPPPTQVFLHKCTCTHTCARMQACTHASTLARTHARTTPASRARAVTCPPPHPYPTPPTHTLRSAPSPGAAPAGPRCRVANARWWLRGWGGGAVGGSASHPSSPPLAATLRACGHARTVEVELQRNERDASRARGGVGVIVLVEAGLGRVLGESVFWGGGD